MQVKKHNGISSLAQKQIDNIQKEFRVLPRDTMFWLIGFLIFMKSIVFIWVTGTVGASGIVIGAAFTSFPMYMNYIGFTLGFMSFSYLFKGRNHLRAMIFLDILATILIIGNLLYFRGFNNYVNMFMFSAVGDAVKVQDIIISLFRPVDIIFIVDIVLLIIYAIRNKQVYRGTKRNLWVFVILFLGTCLYFDYAHYKIDIKNRKIKNQELFVQRYAQGEIMSNLGPIGYITYDAYNYIESNKKYELTKEDISEMEQWYKSNKEELQDNQFKGMYQGKNVILLQVESLENRVIGQSVNGQEITPYLNSLMNHSIYFENYYETNGNGTTSDSVSMVNTGLYPVRDGITSYRYPKNSYPNSLPNLLKNKGYKTLNTLPAKSSFWNFKYTMKNYGYDSNKFEEDLNVTERYNLGMSDEEYFNQVVPEIVKAHKNDKPFLAHTFTISLHSPYIIPEIENKLQLPPELENTKAGDYMKDCYYTDLQIKNFMDALEKEGVLEDTIVVIYGDHTSLHKYYQDQVDREVNAPEFLKSSYPEMWEIPLFIYSKDFNRSKIVSTPGGQVDLLPTLSYLLGVKEEDYSFTLGKNLLNTEKEYTILRNYQTVGEITPEEEQHLAEGMNIADKMLRSDFFLYYKVTKNGEIKALNTNKK